VIEFAQRPPHRLPVELELDRQFGGQSGGKKLSFQGERLVNGSRQ
jgi:hypothetical protein